jgi:hypothetical protein
MDTFEYLNIGRRIISKLIRKAYNSNVDWIELNQIEFSGDLCVIGTNCTK